MSKAPKTITDLMSKPGPKKKATKAKAETLMYPPDMDSVIEIKDLNDIRCHFGELYPSQVVGDQVILQDVEPYCIELKKDKEDKKDMCYYHIYGHIIKDEETNKYKLHVASIPKLQSMLEKKKFTVEKCFEFGNREKTPYPNNQFPAITSDWYLWYMLNNHKEMCGKAAPQNLKKIKDMKRKFNAMFDLPLSTPTHSLPDKQALQKLGHAPVPDVPVKEAEKATPRKRKAPVAEPIPGEPAAEPAVPKKRGPKKKTPVAEEPELAKPEKAKKEKKEKKKKSSSEKEETEKPAKKQRSKKKTTENAQEVVNPAKEEPVVMKNDTNTVTFEFTIEPIIVKKITENPKVVSKLPQYEKESLVTAKKSLMLNNVAREYLEVVVPLAFAVEFQLRKLGVEKHCFTKSAPVEVPRLKMIKFKHGETVKENAESFATYSTNVRKILDDYAKKLQTLEEKTEEPFTLEYNNMTYIEMAKLIAKQDYQKFSQFWFDYKDTNFETFLHDNQKIGISLLGLYSLMNKEDTPELSDSDNIF